MQLSWCLLPACLPAYSVCPLVSGSHPSFIPWLLLFSGLCALCVVLNAVPNADSTLMVCLPAAIKLGKLAYHIN